MIISARNNLFQFSWFIAYFSWFLFNFLVSKKGLNELNFLLFQLETNIFSQQNADQKEEKVGDSPLQINGVESWVKAANKEVKDIDSSHKIQNFIGFHNYLH